MTPTELEHRLTAALTARAEQVTAADLRPPSPPTGQRPPNHHRWMLATTTLAAAVLSIAVLVVLGQLRDAPVRPSHQPPPPAGPSDVTTSAPTLSATPEPAVTVPVEPTRRPDTSPRGDSPRPAETRPDDPQQDATEWATGPAPGVVSGTPSPSPPRPTPSTVPPAPIPTTTTP